MAEYIRYYLSAATYSDDRLNNYFEPWVSYTEEDDMLAYNKTEKEKKGEVPLTFEITSPGNIRWSAYSTAYTTTIEYKKNDGEWTSITSATGNSAPSISVVAGDTVQFRGDNATYCSGTTGTVYYNCFCGTTAQFNVKGNIMSLIDSTDFVDLEDISASASTFRCLFREITNLRNASGLVMPATVLSERCYQMMFYRCPYLAEGPELPATSLTNYCYDEMFQSCYTLTQTPRLPAIGLAEGCYSGMFWGCSGLTAAPVLPATVLANKCYYVVSYGLYSFILYSSSMI